MQGHYEMTAQHKITLAHKTFMLKVWSCREKQSSAGELVLSLTLSGSFCSAKVIDFRAAEWALHQQAVATATCLWSASSTHMTCREAGHESTVLGCH